MQKELGYKLLSLSEATVLVDETYRAHFVVLVEWQS